MINCITISELKNQIVNLIKRNFSNFDIIDEFNKNQFFGKCNNNSICIKLKEIKTNDIAFENYLDFNNDNGVHNQTLGKNANVKFEFLIYTKINDDIDLSDIFLKICSLLSQFDNASFNHFIFSKTQFIENLQAFCTSVFADCDIIITSVNPNDLISDVVISYKQ